MARWFFNSNPIFLNFFFPPFCPGCERYLGIRANPRALCRACRDSLIRACEGRAYLTGAKGVLSAVYSMGPYGSEPLTTLFHKIKYQGKDWAIEALDETLSLFVRRVNLGEIFDLIVPVPLHAWRFNSRGFNQAELIARRLSPILGKPVEAGALRRVRATKAQMSLEGTILRRKNVCGAFAAAEGGCFQNQGILLVDDVVTSGSTLQECAKALLEAGAKKVFAFTLAS